MISLGLSERAFHTSGRASRPLPDHLEGSSSPLGPPGGPPDPSRTSRRASRPLLDFREDLPTPPGPPGWPTDPSQTSGRIS